MIEGGINLGIDAGLKIIKISIFVEGKIVWIDLKVPAMFMWSLTKIPFKVIIRLAWKLTRKPLKLITPKYLQTTLKQLVDDYKMKNKMRKIPQSRFHRMKVSKLK
uniref:Uncharacterized protein n=1 Tax=Schizaphis graminum TaxID=13262 RepID=A0A2S2PT48_SCHGA